MYITLDQLIQIGILVSNITLIVVTILLNVSKRNVPIVIKKDKKKKK